jgi:hypothetical protein
MIESADQVIVTASKKLVKLVVFVAPVLFIIFLLPTVAVGQSSLPQCSNVDPLAWDNCQGTKLFGDGSKYVGEFKNGKPHGHRSLISPYGKYVGDFKNNKFDGQGIDYNADGSVRYSGKWTKGQHAERDYSAAVETIRMEKSGGVYTIPIRFNDTITLDAIVDSGASDVSVPADIVSTLIRTKTVTQEDFLGKQTYVLADGSKVPSQQFRIRSLKVGNKIIDNVVASIASVKGDILLGQSFLSKFKSWSVDNEQHSLILQ